MGRGAGELFKTIVTAAGLFAGTNVDDVIVLSVLLLDGRASGRRFAVLVVVSVIAVLGLTVVPDKWVGLFGSSVGVQVVVQSGYS